MVPARDVKTQKCCNLQHFANSEKLKIVRKMCQNGIFLILGSLKMGGAGIMLLETLMSDPDSVQKAFPKAKDFWCFSGWSEGRRLGARFTIGL